MKVAAILGEHQAGLDESARSNSERGLGRRKNPRLTDVYRIPRF